MFHKTFTLKKMKTSNKLLITLAIVLLTIPLGIMIVIAKMNRVDSTSYSRLLRGEKTNSAEFNKLLDNYETTSFSKLQIKGDGNIRLAVRLVQSEKFGIKTTKNLKGLVKHHVDENGQLIIQINDKDYIEATLLIFSPNLNYLKIDNVSIYDVMAKQDSLTIDVNEATDIKIGYNSAIKNLTLLRNLDFLQNKNRKSPSSFTVTNFNISNTAIDNLTANLTTCNLNLESTSLKSLNLNLFASKAEFNNESNNGIPPIQKLTLNSNGKSEVIFKDIKIDSATGDLSDETKIQIPTVNLKQILRK